MKKVFYRMLKRILISFFASCLIALGIIAVYEFAAGGFVQTKNDIYDFKNFSIEGLSDEEIVTNPDCYKAFMQREFNFTGEQTGLEGSNYSYFAKKITGVITVLIAKEDLNYRMPSGFTIEEKLKSGSATMVVIRDGVIVERIELEKSSEYSKHKYELDRNSEYVIKFICKSAKIEIMTDKDWNFRD